MLLKPDFPHDAATSLFLPPVLSQKSYRPTIFFSTPLLFHENGHPFVSMKTDILFYKLLELEPALLLRLAHLDIPDSVAYRFQAIELKDTAKRTDAVLVPDTTDAPLIVAEVQFQRDATIYDRLVGESARLRRQMPDYPLLQMVAVFPSRGIDPGVGVWEGLVRSGALRVVFMDEELQQQEQRVEHPVEYPIEHAALRLIALTVSPKNEADDRKHLPQIVDAITATGERGTQKALLQLLTNLYLSKYNHITFEELKAMLQLDEIFDDLHENVSVKRYGEQQKLEGKLESIAKLARLGLSAKQIAEALDLPIATVENVAQDIARSE